MGIRRLIIILLFRIYRFIFLIARNRYLLLLASVMVIIYLITSLPPEDKSTPWKRVLSATEQNDTIRQNDKYLNNTIQNSLPSSNVNKTDSKQSSSESKKQETYDSRSRYSFVDMDPLNVEFEYLDKMYEPPTELNIQLPSADSHPLSRLLNVKGDPSIVVYNRIPHCYEYTMRYLLQNISYLHSYNYISSQINTPFSYNYSSLLSIARSIFRRQHDRLIYERHIYFFDFYSLQFPVHPLWINLVQDPIYRAAAEFEQAREVCRKTDRCFLHPDAINDTLDTCIEKRSPKDCISPVNGVSRMLPFFCGLKYAVRCQEEDDWALSQAKENIDFFYTVIGLTDEFYKFLYVLEKVLPQYFQLARLIFMNQHDPKILADIRDVNVTLPNNYTTAILKPLLRYEYKLYNFIKERFLDQYRILVELDS